MRVVLVFMRIWDNKRSHDIIDKSLEMLRRLDHRGGVGADGITGYGAGIMTEIPFAFFKTTCKRTLISQVKVNMPWSNFFPKNAF